MKPDLTIERNFAVLQYYYHALQAVQGSNSQQTTPQGVFDKNGNMPTFPLTYTTVYPNGTSNGATRTTAIDPDCRLCIRYHDLHANWRPARCHGDTRFEYITLRGGNSGILHGELDVPRSAFSADGFNFTMGRGMAHDNYVTNTNSFENVNNDAGIGYLWGIGRITDPDDVDQHGTHQFYTDRYEEIIYVESADRNITGSTTNLPGYTREDSSRIHTMAKAYNSTVGRSLKYTLRLETGRVGYPQAYFGWNQHGGHYNYGNSNNSRGAFLMPHVWVTGSNNDVRLILGNDYDRAREDSQNWTAEQAKDSCSMRTNLPFRGGNFYIRVPYQDQNKVMFTAIIKSGFHGYRMWRRGQDPTAGEFYAGDHVTPGYSYDTTGYSGYEGRYGVGAAQIDALSSSNGSLPYGFGDAGTSGDPKSMYIGVSSNPNMYTGKRYCLIEGGHIWSCVSGSAFDTKMTNKEDDDVCVIRMTGGHVYGAIFGSTNTFANGTGGRQIICTGGKVWAWISGGSNGTTHQNNGLLAGYHDGNTYLYIGGRFILGNDSSDRRVGTYVNTVGWTGANDGNLFGAGAGLKPYNKYTVEDFPDFNEHLWRWHQCGQVWNSTVVVADDAHVLYNVYGGGNYGMTRRDCGSDIRILGGHVGGKVFGGSNNKFSGKSRIRMTGGLVEQGVYGGCNSWGILFGDVRIDILGGTIGSDSWPEASVFGGGYGAETSTSGNITVNIGSPYDTIRPTIRGNVYGGSHMGMVLGGDTITTNYQRSVRYRTRNGYGGSVQYATTPVAQVFLDTAGRYSDTNVSVVNFYAGEVLGGYASPCDTCGKIFGGGFGDQGKNATGYGNVIVNIFGDLDGEVYGSNDAKGEPLGGVQVNIGTRENVTSGRRNSPVITGNVYGGSNEAAFGSASTNEPLRVDMFSGTVRGSVFGGSKGATAITTLPDSKIPTKPVTQVYIHNGTVLGNVYGGGNAAKVVGNTQVRIGE